MRARTFLAIFLTVLVLMVTGGYLFDRIGALRQQEESGEATESTATERSEDRVGELERKLYNLTLRLKNIEEELRNDPSFSLGKMDRDLDAIADGRVPEGSFTDRFLISAQQAYVAGASVKEIGKRFDRLVGLAEQGVHLSSHDEMIVRKSGLDGLQSHLDRLLSSMHLFRRRGSPEGNPNTPN